jgi:L-methionine (R)-S-oxide reductase
MKLTDDMVQNLRDVFTEIGVEGSLEDCLDELSALVARVLRAKGCTIILLTEEEGHHAEGSDRSGFGFLPGSPAGRRLSTPPVDLSGGVGAGVAEPREGRVESMFSTIVLHGKVVGVIQAVPQQQCGFGKDDLDLFRIMTPIITKSVQVIQLQHLLRSRFTQAALATTDDVQVRNILSGIMQNPNQIARILAKSFYREMLNAGFSFNQIIFAATEVISELSASVRKHGARRKQRVSLEQDQPELPWESLRNEALPTPGAAPGDMNRRIST